MALGMKWLTAAAAMAFGTAAWGQDDAGTAPPAPAQAADVAPTVELLDAGSGEKAELRYRPGEGDAFQMTIAMNMSMSMSANGQAMPAVEMPQMLFDATMTADKIEDGRIHYTAVFENARAEGGPLAAQVSQMLSSMNGLKGVGVVTERGFNESLEMEAPDGMAPQLQQQVDAMSASMKNVSTYLPEEAVGEGARWRVQSTIAQNGLSMRQTAEYTLLSIKGGVATLAVKLGQEADPQEIKNDQLPPGVKVELKSFKGSGEGTTTMDMAWLVPVEGSIEHSMDMSMASAAFGEMTQKMTTKTTMTGKRAE